MQKHISKIFKATAFCAISFSSLSAMAADHPNGVRIRDIMTAGSGCPAGTLSASDINEDGSLFKLGFDGFVAEGGPDLPLSESRKNCTVVVDLSVPSGWSYALDSVLYRGYVSLDSGVTATQSSSYYFAGQTATARLQSTARGPIARDFQIQDQLGLSALVWSPCGVQRALNLNIQLRVDASRSRQGSGLITLDSAEAHRYAVKWRRCR